MNDIKIKTDNAILALLLEQQEIEQVKQEVGLVPNEDGYETHAGKFFTTDDLITLRDKAEFGLGSTKFAGIVAKKYDGLNDGQLVFDADGYARVGDEGSLQMIATREDSPMNNGIAFYDSATRKFKTKSESSLSVAQADNANKLGTIASTRYLRNDINDPKLSVSGGLTFTLEADSDNTNESDNVSLFLSQDGGGTTASLGLNSSNDLYLNHGSTQVFKYDEGEDDVIFNSTVHSSAKFNKTVLYSPTNSEDVLNLRRYGNNHTLLNVWSPPQTSWGGAKESTLSLSRGDSNEYYLDLYNMDYGDTDAGNHMDYGNPKMGLRLQKRGSGVYTPFAIEYSDGNNEYKALEIHPNGTDNSNQSSVTLNRLIANYDGNKKFETTAAGVKTIGDHTISGTMYLENDSPDLVFHDTNEVSQYKYWRLTNSGGADKFILAQSSDDSNYVERFSVNELGTKTIGTHSISNANGIGEIGSKNNSWFHFNTDRPNFHFNKGIHVVDRFSVHNTNTYLSDGTLYLNSNDWIKHTDAVNEGWEIVTDGTKDVEILRGVGIKNHRDVLNLGYVGSESFVSGFGGSGWRTDVTGTATFDSLTVRKAFNVYELNVNKIRSGNGSYWFSDGMKFEKDWGTDSTYYRIGLDQDTSDDRQPFRVGDILRCQVWTGTGIKYYTLTVDAIPSDNTYFRALKSSKTGSGIPEIGDELVRIGNATDTNRQGAVYITSNDNNAPYIDVLDGVTSESFADKTKARLGKLDGITSPTWGNLSGYGLWSDNVYLEGKINAKEGLIANCSINSNSVYTSGWTLNSDGSGNLGNGSIAWDINGNTTLGSGVTLQWEHLSAESKANLKGEKGDQGIQGTAGQDGAIGPKGDTGAKGDTGEKGDQGIQGPQGVAGPKGDTGDKGEKGDPGANGINGQDGRDGKDAPVLYSNTETRDFPTGSNYAGGTKHTFTSAWGGTATIWIKVKDAEGGVHCGLNSVDLGTMSGANETTLWYKFDCTIVVGSNEISIWSTTADGGTVYELIVKAEPIKNTYIDSTGLYTGTISANKINAGTISADRIATGSIGASKIKTSELIVGDNIAMGSNATISWNKVTENSHIETKTGAQDKAETAKNEAITEASNDATNKANLAAKMSGAKMLYRDPNFINGWNGTGTYNNTGNGNVVRSLVTPSSDSPNKVGQMMKIVTSGTASPGHGGFYFAVGTHANRELICKFIAKIPVGYTVNWASNAIGTGSTSKWLTSNAGTGRFEEYVYYVKTGYSGTLHSTHYYYLRGGSAPVTWYVTYATVFDSSIAEGYTTTIDANGIYTGTITANQINAGYISADRIEAGTIGASKIKTDELIVGNNIAMGPNAVISWDKVTGTTDINNKVENGVVYIPRPAGATYSYGGGITGAIKITLPQSWTNTMMNFTVDVYNYSAGTSKSYKIGGYNYNSGAYWVNTSAYASGADFGTTRVRFGHDGSKCCIYIGENNTNWSYPKVIVRDFQGGHIGYTVSNWNDGWDVTVTTSITSNIDVDYSSTLGKAGDTKSVDSAVVGGSTLITGNKIRTSLLNATEVQAAVVTASAINGLTCTFNKGTIGGWSINSAAIYTGSYQDSNAYTTSGITIHKDGAIRAKNFRLDTDGNAYFRGEIESTLGTIGGFRISNSGIACTDDSSAYIITRNSTGTLDARIGASVFPASSGASGVGYFCNTETNAFSTNYGLVVKASNDGSYGTAIALDVIGDIRASGDISANSDRTLKKNIKPTNTAFDRITSLNPVTFNWKKGNDKRTKYGFIAQEVEEIYPDLVNTADNGIKSVNYIGMISELVATVQELKRELNQLQNDITN